MEFKETKLLYAAISNNDNRKLDESVAAEWHRSIERNLAGRATLQDCLAVVEEWFDYPRDTYFTKGIFLDLMRQRLRLMPRDIRVDVGLAKRLGFVDECHDSRVPLPLDAANKLAGYRASVNAENNKHALEDGPNASPLELDVGRRV